MKQSIFRTFLTVLVMGCLLVGCHSDIDLQNIDKTAELDFGLALPIGKASATMGDFLGNGQVKEIIVDGNGIFHFIDTVPIPTKTYHEIKLEEYIIKNNNPLLFYIKPVINKTSIDGDGSTETVLPFDLELNMSGINNDTTNERLDSIWVTQASFTSFINVKDFDLDWSEVRKVQLVLGSQFKRPEGDTITIPIPKSGVIDGKQGIPIDVDKFTLTLLKDPSNVKKGTVNTVKFRILFTVCPKNGHDVAVTDDSRFTYNLRVEVVDYQAIWGFFEAGNQMRDHQRIDMDSIWEGWKDVKALKVKFLEPMVDVYVTHRIAAPLMMYIDSLVASNAKGDSAFATWDGKTYPDPLVLRPTLSPYTKNLTDSVINHERFTYESSKGHIDRLFSVRPDYFSYGFYLVVDKNDRADYPYPQHRVVKGGLDVKGYAVADVPFKFDTGSEIGYEMTINDIDLSGVNIDALLDSIQLVDSIKSSDLKLVLIFENEIPFDLDCKVTFLDKDSVDMKLHLIEGNDSNMIHIPAPQMRKAVPYGIVDKAIPQQIVISADRNDFKRFADVKKLHIDALIAGNPQPCYLSVDTKFSVRIGVAAQIGARLDLNGDNKKNK